MAGELVPVIMLRNFSTFSGATSFTTAAIEVTGYTKAILSAWRGKLVGGSTTFVFKAEESTDQESWATCAGSNTSVDPGEETEVQCSATLKKRWFRVKATLTGTNPSATCWAIGFFERRET